MGKVVLDMSVSLDGFSAGPDVSVERPMGEGGERLHEWLFKGSSDPVDAQVARARVGTTGAVIVGRRTYDLGVELWGDTPFPVPCFVLTHETREQLVKKSGTFTYVTSGIESAFQQAQASAGEKNVLLMGGAHIAQQFVIAGLVDEIQIQLVPVLLGAGTRLFDAPGTEHIELERTRVIESPNVTHLQYRVLR